MFGEKVPEVAYKKGMGETEQASPPHGPPAKKSNRRCIIISAVSAVLVVILLIVIVYFSLAPSSDNMSSLVSRLRNAVCDLPPEVGPCRAHFENLHWDPSTKSCKVFVYGGCVGNDNNFQTEEECLALCGDNPVLNKCPERFLDPETDECTLTEAKVAEVEASRPSSTSACPEGQSRGQDGVCA